MQVHSTCAYNCTVTKACSNEGCPPNGTSHLYLAKPRLCFEQPVLRHAPTSAAGAAYNRKILPPVCPCISLRNTLRGCRGLKCRHCRHCVAPGLAPVCPPLPPRSKRRQRCDEAPTRPGDAPTRSSDATAHVTHHNPHLQNTDLGERVAGEFHSARLFTPSLFAPRCKRRRPTHSPHAPAPHTHPRNRATAQPPHSCQGSANLFTEEVTTVLTGYVNLVELPTVVEAAAALDDPTTNCIRSKTKDDEVREGWPPCPALAPLLPSPFEVDLVDTNPKRTPVVLRSRARL